MRKILIIICCSFFIKTTTAQELFVFTEPASNMPSKSVGLRMMNLFKKNNNYNKKDYHLLPEIMVGVNNKLMFHLQGFLSNTNNNFNVEGGGLYVKYRFVSNDEVHQHFRMAAFARASYNNALLHQEEINTMGDNSGFQGGLIATQLLHKVALSSSIGFENAVFNNSSTQPNNAVNYTFSIGKLMLPKEYTSYNQTNVNLMLELLGQKLVGSSKNFIDIAPSVQFIINSVARVDVGYRTQLSGNIQRVSTNIYVLKLEYNLFNVWKAK